MTRVINHCASTELSISAETRTRPWMSGDDLYLRVNYVSISALQCCIYNEPTHMDGTSAKCKDRAVGSKKQLSIYYDVCERSDNGDPSDSVGVFPAGDVRRSAL